MKFCYDLHIHSALSPCADNDMTPVNLVAAASAVGLEIIAVSDHNSIRNVRAAMAVGEALDVTVVPAIELQTNEDIHLLCLFPEFENLEAFYNSIRFTDILNREEIFGEQLVIDEDDEIVCHEPSLLLTSAAIGEYEVEELIKKFNGVAVPAHIDRDAFGMLAILGSIPEYYTAVEFSCDGEHSPIGLAPDLKIIYDSDAHTLADIGKGQKLISLSERSAAAVVDYLRSK